MPLPRVVVFGEALTDVVQTTPGHWRGYPGGAPWNVARTLSNLGVATAFGGAISQDSLGDVIAEQSEAAALDMRFLQRVDAAPLVAIVPSSTPPTYFFAGEADLHFDVKQLPEGWLNEVDACHFSCISLAREPLASTLVGLAKQVKAAGKRLSYDPNWRNLMTAQYREHTFPTLARLADTLKLSDEDLKHLYPGQDEQQALNALRQLNPHAHILFTRGERGLVLFTPEATFEQAALRVDVVDTVGAGDASMAGWLGSAFLGITDLQQRLRYAAACASVSCSHPGAYSPQRGEVDALIARTHA